MSLRSITKSPPEYSAFEWMRVELRGVPGVVCVQWSTCSQLTSGSVRRPVLDRRRNAPCPSRSPSSDCALSEQSGISVVEAEGFGGESHLPVSRAYRPWSRMPVPLRTPSPDRHTFHELDYAAFKKPLLDNYHQLPPNRPLTPM